MTRWVCGVYWGIWGGMFDFGLPKGGLRCYHYGSTRLRRMLAAKEPCGRAGVMMLNCRSLLTLLVVWAGVGALADDLGDKAPPLKIAKWVKGQPVNLADAKNKIHVIEFWSTRCPVCRASIPLMSTTAGSWAPSGPPRRRKKEASQVPSRLLPWGLSKTGRVERPPHIVA